MNQTVLPEVDFIETSPEVIARRMISNFESLADRKLAQADPVRLFILSIASDFAQLAVIVNDSAKQNLLYYSRDSVLDHKGYAWDTPRLGNDAATTIMRFHIAALMNSARIIPAGTEVTADGDLIFRTFHDAVIQPNESFVDVGAYSVSPGTKGNGFDLGTINTMVNPLPYIQRVENITISAGGTEKEKNDDYRLRIQQAPERLSTAGPEGAYEYFARSASAAISDVDVDTPTPGSVHVKILLRNGELPSDEIVSAVQNALSDRKVRPLTDNVTVGAPTVVEYDLNVRYFVDRGSTDITLIQKNIERAIQDYVVWQKSKIGRDINPSKLISDCVRAGAKRVDVISPTFKRVEKGQVAHEASVAFEFGGVEDD